MTYLRPLRQRHLHAHALTADDLLSAVQAAHSHVLAVEGGPQHYEVLERHLGLPVRLYVRVTAYQAAPFRRVWRVRTRAMGSGIYLSLMTTPDALELTGHVMGGFERVMAWRLRRVWRRVLAAVEHDRGGGR